MLFLLPSTFALSLSLESTQNISAGVVLRSYRASSPSTDVYVASIDLCTSGIYVDATRASDSTQSTKDWATTMDTVIATNADFYKTGPLRVYGDAVGGGVRWPEEQTGSVKISKAYWSWWYLKRWRRKNAYNRYCKHVSTRFKRKNGSHTRWTEEAQEYGS